MSNITFFMNYFLPFFAKNNILFLPIKKIYINYFHCITKIIVYAIDTHCSNKISKFEPSNPHTRFVFKIAKQTIIF